jgi:RNA polymerase sigma-70 factor (ECF subfamily)
LRNSATGDKLDHSTFKMIFKDYFLSLCSFAIKYTKDQDEAKDIVHQVFTNLWEKRADIHFDQSIRSYLFTSVHNRCLNYIRDKKKFVIGDLPQTDNALIDYINQSDFLEAEELRKEILAALAELPEGSRKIFKMSRFEGKKYKEIAEELNISIKTVETQMSKALKHMKGKLIKYIQYISLLLGSLYYLIT